MDKELEAGLNGARQAMLARITDRFSTRALEAHVFGSLSTGTSDGLSDIDIWITFSDEDTPSEIQKRFETYAKIGDIVLIHEAQQNSPLNGNYSLVLYETEAGLLQVDYFFAPLTSSRIGSDSTVLFEKTAVPRGEMIYDPKRIKRGADDRVSFLLCMCFVGIKKVVRKDWTFLEFLVKEYSELKEHSFPELKPVENDNSFGTLRDLLQNLTEVSNPDQKIATQKISNFLSKIEASIPASL